MTVEHARTVIRRHAVRVLQAAQITGVMDHVFTSRVRQLDPERELPAIDIDARDGGSIDRDQFISAGMILDRTHSVVIAVTVKKTDGYLDEIDAIFLAIEQTLAANLTLTDDDVKACNYIVPTGEPSIEDDDSGDETIARASMSFDVKYFTQYSAPQTLLGV